MLALLHFGLREGGTLCWAPARRSPAPRTCSSRSTSGTGSIVEWARHGMGRSSSRSRIWLSARAERSIWRRRRVRALPRRRSRNWPARRCSSHTPAAVVVDRDGTDCLFPWPHRAVPRFSRAASRPAICWFAHERVRGTIRIALSGAIERKRRGRNRDGLIGEGEAASASNHRRPAGRPGELALFPGQFRDVSRPARPRQLPGSGNGDSTEMADETAPRSRRAANDRRRAANVNEEMKASHEEVTSINEELQSTNEELETSKEELQSLNEELTTVNAQLQAKMEERRRRPTTCRACWAAPRSRSSSWTFACASGDSPRRPDS